MHIDSFADNRRVLYSTLSVMTITRGLNSAFYCNDSGEHQTFYYICHLIVFRGGSCELNCELIVPLAESGEIMYARTFLPTQIIKSKFAESRTESGSPTYFSIIIFPMIGPPIPINEL